MKEFEFEFGNPRKIKVVKTYYNDHWGEWVKDEIGFFEIYHYGRSGNMTQRVTYNTTTGEPTRSTPSGNWYSQCRRSQAEWTQGGKYYKPIQYDAKGNWIQASWIDTDGGYWLVILEREIEYYD